MATSAETLNCPMCGAAVSSDSTHCEHCGARLATVACPSCFGLMFAGEKFCSHCGAPAARQETATTTTPKLCPRCQVNLEAVVVGNTNLLECSRCEGIWADTESLNQICEDREKQTAVLGVPAAYPQIDPQSIEPVHYVKCPVCSELMSRVNFAHFSGVIVDVCRPHGTWFDKDELRRIVEFIRAGGMSKARASEIEDLERQRQQLQSAQASGLATYYDDTDRSSDAAKYDLIATGITAAAWVLGKILKK
jgi:Zn-finger nucleic acid-binding protein